MKKLLISAASLAAITSSAIAADLPSRKEPIAAPMPTPVWTGFYAGLNAGGTWGNNNNAQFSNYPAYTNPVLKSAPYQLAIISATGNVSVPTNGSAGFIGGGQIGYNHQITNNFVMGIETDIQGIASSGSSTSNIFQIVNYTYTATANGLQTPATAYTSYSASKSIDYIGTVRGRLGFLITPTVQLYGTGGLAYGGANLRTFAYQGLSIPSTDEFGPGASSFSGTLVGWTAGGGVEWMFMPNWSAKAEYLYYDLGSKQLYNGQFTRVWNNHQTVAGISAGDIAASSVSIGRANFIGNIARVGVNYHFNLASTPIVAKF